MADALGVLHVVVPGLPDGNKHLGVLDVLHIEHQIFRPAHLAGKPDVVGQQQVPAVELVPQYAVKVRSGLVHQAAGEGVLVVHALGQKTVFPHLGGPGHAHDAQVVLDLFQHLFGFAGPGGDHHFVGRDHKIGAVCFCGGGQMLGKVRVNVVVTVHKLDVLAAGKLQPQVAGVRHAGVGLVHQHDARVFSAEFLAHGQALVFGAIVQHDDFDVLPGLGTDALQAAGNVVLGVVHGQNDADERLCHGGVSFCG